jgi:hypothetical protein
MDQKFYPHLRAFLLSHLIGDDPYKNLAKIKVIANTNPAHWDGKLPTRGIHPDAGFCKVVEASSAKPVVPWWWYAKQKEPVPAVVKDIYHGLGFDFVVVYPKENAWLYVCAEPAAELLKLLGRQEQLKAFILISLVNKNFPAAQREHKRLHLSTVKGSADLARIFTFIAFREEDRRYQAAAAAAGIPAITRLVHPASNTANWNIRLPGDKRCTAPSASCSPR